MPSDVKKMCEEDLLMLLLNIERAPDSKKHVILKEAEGRGLKHPTTRGRQPPPLEDLPSCPVASS